MNHILEQALIFIGASIILVPIFHRLGLGSILGYLTAGLFVGPYGLGLIRDLESVMHFAELGVIFLLFVIGLEIQPKKLWSMKKDLIGLGGVQILATTIIFASIGILLGFDPVSAGVLAFGMSLSSTAFAIQSLTSKNNFNTEFGKSSFSILLMQDLIAIPALAIIPGLSGHSSSPSTSTNLTWLFPVFLIGLVLISKFLIQPFFRAIAKTNQREIFTATALFVVMAVAVIMLKIGLSAALGTFIAGVLLADSEYRHEIEANLEPFKSLLLGLFFISVGMTVSLPLIFSKPLLIFGCALVYLLIKALVIYGCGRLFKLNHNNAKAMALTIAQGGEFAFVIFSLAAASKIASSETLQTLTAIITISMAVNPLISFIDEKIEQRQENAVVPNYDEIKDDGPEIIIAGFGRFGQMFGRVLRAQNIPFTAIDHDADQVELLRSFGHKVYYGDVSRLDLLESAGAGKAKYLILAVDDSDVSVKTARLVREHFPNLDIFARARNRGHVFDLLDLGVRHVKRETFDSSVNFVGDLLLAMGQSPEMSKAVIERFKKHDQNMLIEQYKVREDDDMFMSKTKQGGVQLSNVLSDESLKSYIGEPESKI
jgi:monovalent cation:proton antiporter-2 (CPA2) family protein